MTSTSEVADFKKLKVQELRDELKKRDLDTTGTKPILLSRLEEAAQSESLPAAGVNNSEPQEAVDAPAATSAGTAPEGIEADLEPEKQSSDVAVPEAAKPQESEVDKAKKRAERFGIEFAEPSKAGSKPAKGATTAVNGKAAGPVAKPVKEEDPGEIDRRKDRAKRFGMPAPTFASEEQEKRKARAARFEVVGAGTTVEQKEKLEKRNKRFGSAGPPAINGSSKAPAEPKMEARSKRFGSGSTDSAELDAKKKARAERFAPS